MFGRILMGAIGAATIFAGAAARDRVATDHAESVLAPARDGFAPGEATIFAFSQQIEKGWHVYWKNPGDSGLPLDFQWSLPEGFEASEIAYPVPERIPVGPLANFGHFDAPVFLASVKAPADAVIGSTVDVGLTATWLICEEICVPESGEFSLVLPVVAAPAANPAGVAALAAAKAMQPAALSGEAVFDASAARLALRIDAPLAARDGAYFFPDAEGLIEPAAPQTVARDGSRLTIAMKPGFALKPHLLETLSGVLAVTDNGVRRGYALTAARAAEPIAIASAVSSGAASAGGLAVLLVTAFLGGVLLNIMPCVFPVIFIKAASLMAGAGASPRIVRMHGLLYAAGVVATFAALGGLLLALRAGGDALGWGFHLQSPVVVLISAYVLFLVGLNFAGVFQIGQSLQGVGADLAAKSGAAGSFFTGVLAVFVAAPCIGPLLTAPIGAAVLLPPLSGMLIFIAMALGLAAPYLALSFVPALGRRLPRPGAWMEIFKQALAFPVFAAAAFFLWVLAQQTGPSGLARALGGAVLLAFAAWLFEHSKGEGRRALIVRVGAGLAALGAIAPLADLKLVDAARASDGKVGALESMPFDPAAIAAMRAEGRTVFVDFTAAWCVTCQFDRLTVLSKPSLAEAFAAEDVAFMVADWTRRDPEITAALAGFGANGVPLYVVYPPEGAPHVLALPLTERGVLDAVRHR